MVAILSNDWKNKKIRIILPLVHFILSFIYDRSIFIFHLDKNVVSAIPMNYIVSDRVERIFGYITIKILALLFIFALWGIIWFLKDNIKRCYVKMLIIIFAVLSLIYLLIYPFYYSQTWDSFVTYSYAIRLWPEYWHSAYSSLIYGGLLMTVPSPAGMGVLQILYAVGAVGYLYNRIVKSSILKGRGRQFTWLLLLIPVKDNIFYSAYRTNQYAILGIFFIALLAMDIVEKKERSTIDILLIIALASFFSIWRTEGVILGALVIFISIIFIYGKTKKMKLLYIVFYMIATLLILIPQKIGDIKYYGKDYEFINSFGPLYNILNDTSHNLSYEGVEDDLAALNEVVPIDLLTYRGIDGYRRYNYENGRPDINQSMASNEIGKAYNAAYLNLVKHNIKIYAKTQLTAMGNSLGYLQESYKAPYIGGEVEDYPEWVCIGWENGREDILARKYTDSWSNYIGRQYCLLAYLTLTDYIKKICDLIYFKAIACFLIIISLVTIPIVELVNIFRKKTKDLPLALFSVAVLGQLFAIMLVMPESNIAYFQPSLCCGMVIIIVYLTSKYNHKK